MNASIPLAEPQMTKQPQDIVVLGAGTWGITLATVLAENSHRVRSWDIDAKLLENIDRERVHPKLEGFKVHPDIAMVTDLGAALDGASSCVMVAPSHAMRKACESIKATGRAGSIRRWIICTKGIEQGTDMLMHEVLADVLGPEAGRNTCVLSGPSHAEEVSRRIPTMLVASSATYELAREIQTCFFRPYLRIYTCNDMRGVELGGSVKNVIAIAAGVADGMGMGDNTRAALITRGLAEMVRLGLAAGARLETFMGLSGVGDLIVTAGSHHSRNWKFGNLLAQGLPVDEALKQVGMVVEGYWTAKSVCHLADKHKVEMPIAEAVRAVLFEGVSARQAVESLLARDPKPEHY
ncbi:NAD(P)-dependent glycerol-3-phosphate dehydrogenase [bacterium]|nr:NAD(P)-dependent glycerol-3-phosphate dehydrogenase [bacterium]